MNRISPLIALVTILSSLAFGGAASAQSPGAYFDGSVQQTINPLQCIGGGGPYFSIGAYTGYFKANDNSYPKTGDTVYVHAVAAMTHPCWPDSAGFTLYLPEGAQLAVNASRPVYCYRVNANGSVINLPNASDSACVANPSAGGDGGYYLGFSSLASGQFLEIQVPVTFNKELLGLAEPASRRLRLKTQTANAADIFSEQFVTVPYRAVINYPTAATNITSTSAQLNAELYSYYKGGTAFFDYGLNTSYGSSVSQTVASTGLGYNVFNDVTGLAPSTTYNYRLRYVTASGTFTGVNRTFTTAAAPNQTLSVTKTGTGAGTVSSNPTGINCGATCSATFTGGSSVTLTAIPTSGSRFGGWSGACTGGATTCTVTLNAALSVNASFQREIGSLSYTVTGLPSGTSVTLGLTGPEGFSTLKTLLTGTGQNLSDVVTGAYTLTAPNVVVSGVTYAPNAASQTVNVTFGGNATINVVYTAQAPSSFALSVTKAGTGAGTVSSAPAGLDCGATCSASFPSGSSVTLTAAPSAGSSFAAWGSACSGSNTTCTLTMSAAQTVTATFNTTPPPTVNYALTVTKSGTGAGTVSSQPAGIDCGATCTANFPSGSSVTLTAAPSSGSSFTGWGGACTGAAATCTVTMSAVQTVTASFATTPPAPTNFALTITKSGAGTGSVSSNPGGISCGATCTANFGQSLTVTLTATPDAGSSFAAWGGACSGSGACVVTMSAAQNVTATFTLNAPAPPTPPSPPSPPTPPTPPAPPPASLGKPSSSPASLNASKSERNVSALGLELGVAASSSLTLQGLNLSVTGTGNDALDITGVKLYVDANGNGIVDSGETALAQGTFGGNDGTVALTLASPRVFAANSNTKLLVTLDFNSSLAQTSNKLALGSLGLALLLGWRSKKRLAVVGLLALAVTLNACPAPVTPPTGSSTYSLSLTGISLKDSSGAAINVGGLPIAGTTITVTK